VLFHVRRMECSPSLRLVLKLHEQTDAFVVHRSRVKHCNCKFSKIL
jgi:hypothetical protein